MTSDLSPLREAFVWIWLPGRSEPVVAGRVRAEAGHFVFNQWPLLNDLAFEGLEDRLDEVIEALPDR